MEGVVMVVRVRWWLWESFDKTKRLRVNHKPYSLSRTFIYRADPSVGGVGSTTLNGFCQDLLFSAQRLCSTWNFFEKRC